ncbi:MAG: M48 family metallopeptidase [Alphaproteobacteria bacterium]|nr:M48 family metallopeptidase [Alphaproteobacteria bacterium]
MKTGSIGLQTYIWNNNLKSLLLLGLYPFVIMGLFWACAYVVAVMAMGNGGTMGAPQPQNMASAMVAAYWPMVLAVVVIWFIVAWFFNTKMVRALSHAHPVTRKEEPELYNLLENLCIAQGMKTPRLEIIETHARNAFASGVDERSYSVTVTRGLMNALTKEELEGVLAHELTHIINRDVRLLIVTIIFTGMIGFAAQLVWSQLRYGFIFSGRRRQQGGGVLLLLAIAAILWIGYMATLFTRFALSRRREYMADAGAIKMTKNPEAMMSALQRIAGRDQIPQAPDDIAMMCIENAHPFMGLFATHPPIGNRIKALAAITGAEIPVLSTPPVEESRRFNQNGPRPNPWLVRERRR